MKNNPSLKPVQQRLIDKLTTKGLSLSTPAGARVNPYSGEGADLCPLAAALVDWIVSPNRGNEINAGKLARNDWDRARYLFLDLWPDAYYTLID